MRASSDGPLNPEQHLDVAAVAAAAAVRAAVHAAVGVSPAVATAQAAEGQHAHAAALVAVKPAAMSADREMQYGLAHRM